MDIAFFDRTARGRLIITGRDRADLLHRLATTSIMHLKPGEGTQTCFCTSKGRLIDWTEEGATRVLDENGVWVPFEIDSPPDPQ